MPITWQTSWDLRLRKTLCLVIPSLKRHWSGFYELFQERPALKQQIVLPVHETEYLRLAEFWIEKRGNNIGKPDWKNQKASEQFVRNQEYGTGRPSWGTYAQDDASVFEQKDIHGHAVRATLLCTGIAAAARVNNDERYRETAIRLWENMVYRRMHVTGGVGAYSQEEKFGADYAPPNNAYNETCAAVGAGFFHHNMTMAFGHSRYADELERVCTTVLSLEYLSRATGISIKTRWKRTRPANGGRGTIARAAHPCFSK